MCLCLCVCVVRSHVSEVVIGGVADGWFDATRRSEQPSRQVAANGRPSVCNGGTTRLNVVSMIAFIENNIENEG